MSDVNLSMTRGDTATWNITVTRDGILENLTGAKIWMTARRHSTSPTPVFQKDSASGGITIDPDQTANRGKAVIKLAVADTSILDNEEFVLRYDIQVKTATGDVFTPFTGNLTVSPEVTLVTS
jgi:hypothetical protein